MTQTDLLRPSREEPLRIVIPWKTASDQGKPVMVILPDNAKSKPVRFGRAGMRIKNTDEYNNAKMIAENKISRQVKGRRPAFTCEVRAHYDFYYPDVRRRDMLNHMKLINDAMEKIVYADDADIVSASQELHGVSRTNPRVEITISPR